ncbi:amidohydrolase [Embleya sp. MST-111070]|uniref:amidohydrolase n=1 Tax=Embleya sp. MST-111070 TaxID=3398231 RepID=UPI003F73C059
MPRTPSPTPALRIFRARRIVTFDRDAEAFATLGERVIDTGTLADLRYRFPLAEIVDLGDRLVVPGFNDAHCHPSVTAETRLRLDVSPAAVKDVEDLRRVLSARAAATPEGGWIFAAGFNPAGSAGSRIDRNFLDAISTRHPIVVVLFNWHIAVVNSMALESTGLTDASEAPVGGELGFDTAGRLDGWLYEQAFLEPYWSGTGRPPWVPEPDQDSLMDALVEENNLLHSVGITSYCDAIVTPRVWRTYQATRDAGRLTARVGMLLWSTYFDTAEELGLGAGFGDDRLRFLGIKAMYDGALSGGTCLCSTPYASATDGRNGIQLVDERAFADLVGAVHAKGMRIAVHANGDRAISEVLDAIEAAQAASPGAGLNHRIEHCSMVDDQLLERIRAAGVTPVPFSGSIRQHGPQLVGFYGADRAATILPHRSFLDAGIVVGGSSDYPTTPIAPLTAIASMTTRATAEGQVIGADQRISVLEALELYSVGSAHACGEGDHKGRLAPGYLADFTVLDTDIITAGPEGVSEANVLSTWVGAERVWSS